MRWKIDANGDTTNTKIERTRERERYSFVPMCANGRWSPIHHHGRAVKCKIYWKKFSAKMQFCHRLRPSRTNTTNMYPQWSNLRASLREHSLLGEVSLRLVFSSTSLDSTASLSTYKHTYIFILVKSNLVKLETSCTAILPLQWVFSGSIYDANKSTILVPWWRNHLLKLSMV